MVYYIFFPLLKVNSLLCKVACNSVGHCVRQGVEEDVTVPQLVQAGPEGRLPGPELPGPVALRVHPVPDVLQPPSLLAQVVDGQQLSEVGGRHEPVPLRRQRDVVGVRGHPGGRHEFEVAGGVILN